jgi:hypothetical protein
MATVLDVVLPKSSELLCAFCWQKYSMQRIFIKKCFLLTVGSVCREKRFAIGLRNFPEDFRESQMTPDKVRKWLRQQSDDLYDAGGSRRTGKAMGQVYQCWRRICREINVFFPVSNITCFQLYMNLWPVY